MNAKVKHNYGPYFDRLSEPEKRAVEKYVRKLAKLYPELAEKATAGPGNEGAIYVRIPYPSDEDEYLKIHWKIAKIGMKIYEDTGVDIIQMPAHRE